MKNAAIGNYIKTLGSGSFKGCSSLSCIEITDSVSSIGDNAFSGCCGVQWIYFNAKNCTLGNNCFELESSIEIPLLLGKSVENITGSFNLTPSLIISQAIVPPAIMANTFISDTYSRPLFIPYHSYTEYWIADIWTKFNDLREISNPIKSIELNQESITIASNRTSKLIATIIPNNATLKYVYWNSDNPSVASVDQNGNVTGIKEGLAIITATAIDGSKVQTSCKVKVGDIIAESIALSPSEMTLEINQSARIGVVSTPESISNNNFEWVCSNIDIVSYRKNSDGSLQVLGLADGTATITCRTTDGSNLKASCKVTVGIGGVEGVEADGIVVIARDGMISVTGVAPEARIEVYNAAGMCIYSGTNHEVPVAQRGIYIVKAQGKATKVAL